VPGDVLAAEFYDQRPTADVVRIPPIDPGPDQWKQDHRRPARRRCHTRGQEPLAPTQQYCLSICLMTWPQISPHRWTVLDNPEAQPIDHAPAKPT
jgi:hypothetical protein